jgi:hypothetical protein
MATNIASNDRSRGDHHPN